MALPLMPMATAVWLVESTKLTFEQIADFCGMHTLEVQAIADGEVAVGIVGLDPVSNGQLTREEIVRCEQDPSSVLRMSTSPELIRQKARGARYTPVAKRQDKPDAISWLLRHHPELSDAQVGKLIGTTKDTIAKVRDRTHWNAINIKPRNPVTLGLCSEAELEKAVALARHRGSLPAHPPVEPMPEEIVPEPEKRPVREVVPTAESLFATPPPAPAPALAPAEQPAPVATTDQTAG